MKTARKYYTVYTILFSAMVILVFYQFIINGKSFVYCDTNEGGDGLVQHYNSFVYYGQYLRSILKGILFEHKLEIPMWDFSIGYGQDILSTLSYYVIGDPFSFLSVLFPTKYAEYGYDLMILLRIYCAGLAFSVYCRYLGHRSWHTLTGTIIYIFSSYTLYIAVLHPYFILPLIWLPWLLLGVEKVLHKQGNLTFIAAVAISGISNFYFFYMLCIVVILYTIFRYVHLFGRIRLKEVLPWIGRFLLDAILGISMAAVLLLPSIINILSSSRVSADNYVPMLYEASYYFGLIPSFLGASGSYYAHMGYTTVAFVSVVMTFLRSPKYKTCRFLCAGFLLLTLFVAVPFFGHMFNGFSYVTNRWIWAMAFLTAYITVTMLPELQTATRKEWKIILFVAFVAAGLTMWADTSRTEKNMMLLFLMAITILVLWFVQSADSTKMQLCPAALLLVMGAISLQAFYTYSPTEGNYLKYFADSGEAYSMLVEESPEYILKDIDDNTVYRFDTAGISTGDVKRNSAMLLDMNGTAYYYSTVNANISNFISDMYINYSFENSYNNLDRRSWLDVLASVKYIIIPEGKENLLPYSYDTYVISGNGYSVYTSESVLPFGFTSDIVISQETYDMLSTERKQQAILQGIVVDGLEVSNASGDDLAVESALNLAFEEEVREVTVTQTDGVTWEDGKFTVEKEGGTVTLSFDEVENGELYFLFEGLSFEAVNPYSLYSQETIDSMTTIEKNAWKRNYKNWTAPTAANITVKSGSSSTTTVIRSRTNAYYYDCHEFLCNLGYIEGTSDTITLTFATVGEYTCDNLRVVSQPMDSFEEYCTVLQDESLQNVTIDTKTVTGSISLSSEKVLCIQIPYSEGWAAYVDGVKTETFCADGMYTGIVLSAGEHQIEFLYVSPYFMISVVISIVGCVIFIAWFATLRICKKNRQKLSEDKPTDFAKGEGHVNTEE